jgi:hypothetical protein
VKVLPEFTSEGDLPIGVHVTDWQDFRSRFGASTPRRVWLFGRLQALVALAANTGKLRSVFVWGSFVTTKLSPKDLDILLINSIRAKLLFESDVFWARASVGEEILKMWLETYQISRSFRKRGIVELELP